MENYGPPNRRETSVVMKWILWIVAIALFASAVAGIGHFAFGWFSVPGKVLSVENVQKQWAFAYQYDEDLQAAARQVCNAEGMVALATSETEKTQRRDQLFAFQQNYTRLEADYNAALRNAFEAKYVKPADVPNTAPTLDEMKARVCPQPTATPLSK